jgi:hypothetical protein
MATRQSLPGFGKAFDRVDQFVGHGPDATALPFRSHTTPLPLAGVRRDALVDAVADAVRQMQRTAVGLTVKEAQLLKDVGRGRYVGGVLKALEIGQKCEDMADATAFPEALRGWQVRHHQASCCTVIDAFRGETDANGIANMAQFEFEIAPTEANRQRALEALRRQREETDRAIIALHKHAAWRA